MTKWRNARKKPLIVDFREVEPNFEMEYGSWKNGFKKTPVERVKTLEGTLMAFPERDFIIRGVKGKIYPIKKSIFKETYDVLETPLEAYVKMKEEEK